MMTTVDMKENAPATRTPITITAKSRLPARSINVTSLTPAEGTGRNGRIFRNISTPAKDISVVYGEIGDIAMLMAGRLGLLRYLPT